MRLTKRQIAMIIDSDPDDITGKEGVGVELRSGSDYAVAKALERRGFGHVEGPGGFLPGMYWNRAEGLAVRLSLLGDTGSGDEQRSEPNLGGKG